MIQFFALRKLILLLKKQTSKQIECNFITRFRGAQTETKEYLKQLCGKNKEVKEGEGDGESHL